MAPAILSQVLRQLPNIKHPSLLVGAETSDDAAVYKLSEEIAVIQTVDFFTPMVDDPYTFGAIAAANSLSDIYAMGGTPILALNVVCFPSCLDPGVLVDILKGGADKVMEAGAIIAGGHTVQDDEPKYGLAVTGVINPREIYLNAGTLPGDILVLTKPLGTGIINTAIKGELADENTFRAAVASMKALNRDAATAMKSAGARACTDITGFGLLGHAAEMARASGVSLSFNYSGMPILPGAKAMAAMGMIPAGAYANRDFLAEEIHFVDNCLSPEERAILFDPQTSGGLLIAIPPTGLEKLLEKLRESSVTAAPVGRVLEKREKLIYVNP